MIFWAVVLGVIAVVLFLAWRRDRRGKVDLNGRHLNDLQSDMASKNPDPLNGGPDPGGGGGF